MQAVLITQPGEPSVLQPGDVDTPAPGPQQILVRVHATAINRADLLQRRGFYPAPPGYPDNIPGLEYAGVVAHLGDGATCWSVGDKVMGLVGGGAYAEYVVVHEAEAMPMPATLSFEEAAAIPEVFFTAYDALNERLHVRAGETVLIHAVASGVGTAAVQLARHAGCRVIGTARSQDKLERVAHYGVDLSVNVTSEDFVQRAMEFTEQRGVEAIVDLVGGDYLSGNVRALARLGRIAVIGLVARREAMLDMGMLLSKRATIVGTALRSRTLEEKIDIAQAFARDVLPLFATHEIEPVIDQVLPIREAAQAHRIVEANRNVGKVVLRAMF